MFDLSQPIQMPVIIGSIVFIFAVVGVGLGVVGYHKRKMERNLVDTRVKEYENIDSFIFALEKYMNENTNLDNVEEIFENLEDKYSFPHFYHYLSDEDIREKHKEYEKMQNTELEKFIDALKNQSWDKAEDITFLGNSPK